jgi:hypothetical protein
MSNDILKYLRWIGCGEGDDARNEDVRIADAASDEIERLRTELDEQARLNGMGAERELALRARIAVLEGTLGWYAEPTNYAYQSVPRYCGCCFDSMRHIDNDEGTRARAALAEQENR